MYIKKIVFIGIYLACYSPVLNAQLPYDSISQTYVEKTIRYLASDKLGGRVNFTKEQLEVTEFLSEQFTQFGLNPFPGMRNFLIPYHIQENKKEERLEWNDRKIPDSLFLFMPSSLVPKSVKLDDFTVLKTEYPLADSLLYFNWRKPGKVLLWISLPGTMSFSDATKNILFPMGMPSEDLLMVAAKEEPVDLKFSIRAGKFTNKLFNVVGILPGDSLPGEAILFSAHYDHVAEDIHGERGGTFNGANDNASGTTAVLALAKYFAARRDNRRTILFCLFSGEELGLLGSTAFVKTMNTASVKAVINIEMIGRHNRTGKNAFMVTGAHRSDLADILGRNLKGERVKLIKLMADPMELFFRSDNYPFYQQGIPAHTLMSSDDDEPCYHKPCDDDKRIDMENMTIVIRAIAKSAESLINGNDTPVLKKK
jgi:hypothetical protein